jgi:hypothetical protein
VAGNPRGRVSGIAGRLWETKNGVWCTGEWTPHVFFLYSAMLQGEGGAHVRHSIADTTGVTQFDKKQTALRLWGLK